MKIFNLLLANLAIWLIGCATMFNSGSQTIQARSANGHEGVEVEIKTSSGAYTAKLPTTIVATPSLAEPVTVRITDKCYRPTTTVANKSITPSYWANFFNYIGFVVDPLTGNWWKYDSHVSLVTEKIESCK